MITRGCNATTTLATIASGAITVLFVASHDIAISFVSLVIFGLLLFANISCTFLIFIEYLNQKPIENEGQLKPNMFCFPQVVTLISERGEKKMEDTQYDALGSLCVVSQSRLMQNGAKRRFVLFTVNKFAVHCI